MIRGGVFLIRHLSSALCHLHRGDNAAVAGGILVADVAEACFGQQLTHLAGTVAASFGDAHQQRRVGGDGGRAGLVVVEVRVMDDEQAALRQGLGRGGQQEADLVGVPVMQDVGEEVDVVAAGRP